jgi:transglutaminase-like putative cysteine protease
MELRVKANDLATSQARRSRQVSRSAGPIGTVWMPRRRHFAVIVLVFLAFWAGDPWNWAEAAQRARATHIARPAPVPVELDAGGELESAVHQTLAALKSLRRSAAADVPVRAADLAERFAALQKLDAEVRASFEAVQRHIEKARLPRAILQRQSEAVARYEAGFDLLQSEVARATSVGKALAVEDPQAAGAQRQELLKALDAAERQLSTMLARPVHTALDPEKLPHRLGEPQRRAPRLKASEFTEFRTQKPQQSGAAGRRDVKVLGFGQKAAPPTPADLAATLEVQLTPEITQKAAELGNDPLRIFAFVHNSIDFTPTRGSIQGAAACLQTRLCNDMDTASLLIALLRSAGVPARYAMGTVQVDVGRIKNLAGGFTSAQAALNFLASSGTPVTGLTAGGTLVAARMEHVWVEAFLDYVPSRGAVRGEPDTWVPLDASFKQLAFTPGIDVAAVTGFNSDAFFNQLVTSATGNAADGELLTMDIAGTEQKLAEVQSQVLTYANGRGTQATGFNTIGGSAIVPQTLSVLPGSLPYQVLARGAQFAEVPDSLRHKLLFEVSSDDFALSPELSYTAALPQLAGKRITLSYAPATAADQATLESFVPHDATSPADLPTSLPAYLVQVKPELRIDGQVVATGGNTTLGQTGRFLMFFTQPGGQTDSVDNVITAGTYNAIVLNLGRTGDTADRRQAASARRDRIAAGDFTGLTKDDVMGDFLDSAGLRYWSQLELFEVATAHARGIAATRLPSEGIFTYDLKVQTLFGVPRTVSSGAVITDVDRDVVAALPLNGDSSKVVSYMATTGGFASRSESAIWEQSLTAHPTGAGINAMSFIEAAVRQGIPIFHITRDNLDRVLPQLAVSAAVKTDIRNSINAGKVVTIPQREFLKDGFTGVGYVVFDLATGAAGYLISSGQAGGGFRLPPLGPMATFLLGILLVGIGAIALAVGVMWLVIAAAIAGIVLAIYDAVSTYQEIAAENPDLTPEQLSGLAGVLAMIAVVSIVLAIAGIFGGPLGLLAFAAYWAFASVMLEEVIKFYLNLFRRETTIPEGLFDRRRPDGGERLAGVFQGFRGSRRWIVGQPRWA